MYIVDRGHSHARPFPSLTPLLRLKCSYSQVPLLVLCFLPVCVAHWVKQSCSHNCAGVGWYLLEYRQLSGYTTGKSDYLLLQQLLIDSRPQGWLGLMAPPISMTRRYLLCRQLQLQWVHGCQSYIMSSDIFFLHISPSSGSQNLATPFSMTWLGRS